jgi:Xaa-Pro aminopeptidase
MNHAARRAKLLRLLKRDKLDGMLVTDVHNVTYLTGFTGDSSYLALTPERAVLVSDERYTLQIDEECPELETSIRGPGTQLLDFAARVVEDCRAQRLAIEADSVTVTVQGGLAKRLPQCDLVPTTGLVESLRAVKDREEIERIRRACDLARRAFEVVRATMTPEMSELDIAADLEYQARRFGGRGLSFPPIVGVGPRAALPHGTPTARTLGESDFTLIDWGVRESLYVSDLTRIVATSKISPKLRKLYDIVLQAQLAAIAAIRPGATCESIDWAARSVIEEAGYGKQFAHGLGHGIGLQVHEAPRFARGQSLPLAAGMVVTVEPGIYLPGWGGIRIEDDVLVTRDGCEVLTSVPKQLDECLVG